MFKYVNAKLLYDQLVVFIFHDCTGCSLNIVFFPKIFEYSGLSGLSLFSLGVSVCTHTWQVEHQHCSRVHKNHFVGWLLYLSIIIFWGVQMSKWAGSYTHILLSEHLFIISFHGK